MRSRRLPRSLWSWVVLLGVFAVGLPVAAQPPAAPPAASCPAPAPKQAAGAKPAAGKPDRETKAQQAVKQFESESREVFQKRHQIVDACRLEPGMDVADIGAGSGLFTRLFAAKVAPDGKVYAVDIVKNYVDHIVETAKKEKLANVVGVVCTADSTELAPHSIDLAFVCDTYHHFNHPEKNLASIHRALRPGGRLVVVEFKKEKGVAPDWVMKHVRPDRETLIKEVTEAEFALVDEPALMKMQQVYRFVKK